MKNSGSSVLFWFIIFLSACGANSQIQNQFSLGKQALLTGNYGSALTSFRIVAEQNPNYVTDTEPVQGIWTYMGLAEYLSGNFAESRRILEKAVSQPQRTEVARLYLGLTLAHLDERRQALKDIEAGMRGIHDFLDSMNQNYRYGIGQFYDPGRAIRSAIEREQAMIASGKIDWSQLISEGEKIGLEVEQESDRARKQHLMDQRDQM